MLLHRINGERGFTFTQRKIILIYSILLESFVLESVKAISARKIEHDEYFQEGKGISVSLLEILCMERLQNFQRVKGFFVRKLGEIGYDGAIGVAEFKKVYDDLMPVQKSKLMEICGEEFDSLLKDGYIICISIAYPEYAIDCINIRLENGTIIKTHGIFMQMSIIR